MSIESPQHHATISAMRQAVLLLILPLSVAITLLAQGQADTPPPQDTTQDTAQDTAQDTTQAPAAGEDAHRNARTGAFATHFSQRSPHSDLDRLQRVGRWQRESMSDWDIEDIEFQMLVPDDYDGSEAYGLLVFIHPFDDIDPDNPRTFYASVIADVLAKHKLIWVSYDDAGNSVLPHKRMGLALDAVHNAAEQYNIDPERIYVSGMSGGGRMTCMTAIYYPQIFTGAVPIVGTLYFRNVPVPNDPELRALIRPVPTDENAVWPRGLWTPSRTNLRRLRRNRFVLLTGERDFNMPQMRAHFEHGFQRDEFEHAHYLEVPGMGHTFPDAQWFERAVVLLDAPLNDDDTQPDDPQLAAQERSAQRRVDAARELIETSPQRALRLLQSVVDRYPDTQAADQARELIAQIEIPEEGTRLLEDMDDQ